MSSGSRIALVAVAVIVGVVAFATLHPSDENDGGAEAPDRPSKAALAVLRPGAVRTIEVQRGERVRFVVRSPEADEAHVHGYDLLKDVPAGGRVRFSFRAELEGEFEIELEHSQEQIGNLVVTP